MMSIMSYTGFDKVGKVRMGNDSLVYTYGYGHQRIAMEEHVGNTVKQNKSRTIVRLLFVVPAGIEPATHGFSVRCSTN